MVKKEFEVVEESLRLLSRGYYLVTSDDDIREMVTSWQSVERIALDFEGEFNLHVYGEHLCLVQIFDGASFYIVDVRSDRITPKGLETLFSTPQTKLWFDCQSDHSLVYKRYGLRIANIRDIRIMATFLGYNGNLISLEEEILGLRIEINKKKSQQANWIKRPLSEELIKYALLDVAYLDRLDQILTALIAEKGEERTIAALMRKAAAVKKYEPGWTKIGPWRRYSDEEKERVKAIYLERDSIAKRFNVPASRILSKDDIVKLTLEPPKSNRELSSRLECVNPRFIGFMSSALRRVFKL